MNEYAEIRIPRAVEREMLGAVERHRMEVERKGDGWYLTDLEGIEDDEWLGSTKREALIVLITQQAERFGFVGFRVSRTTGERR